MEEKQERGSINTTVEITREDVLKSLKAVGVSKGDTIFVHSGIGNFGLLKEAKDKFELSNVFIDCFLNAVGSRGTVCMPTFSYSFAKKKNFDVLKTPSLTGTMTEVFRKREGVVRSCNPNHSVVASGFRKDFLTTCLSKTSFGANTFFSRLLKADAKNVFFGVDLNHSCTFIHFIEESVGVPYRFHKKTTGKILFDKEESFEDCYYFYAKYLGRNINTSVVEFEKDLKEKNILKSVDLGKSFVMSAKVRPLFREGVKKLKENKYYFLKNKPWGNAA